LYHVTSSICTSLKCLNARFENVCGW
jgi:hypothetical protein